MVHDPQGPDRRLGRRYAVPSVEVGWRLRRVDTPRGQVVVPSGVTGLLLDLSVTGARVDAPASPDLEEGSTVLISIIGTHGPVTIRRISPGLAEETRMFGLEFGDRSPLTELVHDDLLQTFSAKTADHWHLPTFVP